jgi:hypothetical protein
MKNIRDQIRKQAEYYRSSPLQRCIICGRLFTLRVERVCSRDCQAKFEALQQQASTANASSR